MLATAPSRRTHTRRFMCRAAAPAGPPPPQTSYQKLCNAMGIEGSRDLTHVAPNECNRLFQVCLGPPTSILGFLMLKGSGGAWEGGGRV